MINLDDKKAINQCLFNFKTEVKNIEKGNAEIFKGYNLRILWICCQKFIMNIINQFPIYNDNKEIDCHKVEILEYLDLESLNFSMKKDFIEQVKKIEQYVTEKSFKEVNM